MYQHSQVYTISMNSLYLFVVMIIIPPPLCYLQRCGWIRAVQALLFLTCVIARKRLKIDGHNAAMRLTSIESFFHPCNIYRGYPGGVPREPKMCRAILLVYNRCSKVIIAFRFMCTFMTVYQYVSKTSTYLSVSVYRCKNFVLRRC